MAYFGGSQGGRGDPGFFDVFKKIGGAFLGATPIGAAIKAGLGQFRGKGAVQPRTPFPTIGGIGGLGIGGLGIGGPSGRPPKSVVVDVETGMVRPKRRRMNVGNAKALRRAIRRTDGFVTLAKGALKNTGFKIVSKSSGKVSRATMDKAVAAAHHRK